MAIRVLYSLLGPLLGPLAGSLFGRNDDAAVVAAGFGSVSLGSPPAAKATMAIVTQRYGASRRIFIIAPLVPRFVIDIADIDQAAGTVQVGGADDTRTFERSSALSHCLGAARSLTCMRWRPAQPSGQQLRERHFDRTEAQQPGK